MEAKERKRIKERVAVFGLLVLFLMGVLVIRLFDIQILQGDAYRSSAERNRTRLITLRASRGDILSADGVVLATDQPVFEVVLNNQTLSNLSLEEREQVLSKLVDILQDEEITVESIKQQLSDNKFRLYQPVIVKKNLDMETISKISARGNELLGVTITSEPQRIYLQGDIASHVIGYIGEVSQEELESNSDYKMGEYVGKIGVEKSYEEYLHGEDGLQQIEVDVYNHALGEVATIDAVQGNNVILTIDFELQKTLEEAFDDLIVSLKKQSRSDKVGAGAAVAVDVHTGKILAMVSRPNDKIAQQNRAIQGRYIPGSTFKPLVLTAALEAKVVSETERIYNPGRYWEPPYIKTTAPIGYYTLYTAIAKSDNVFFQEMGRRVGVQKIGEIGKELGLEGATGIDLPYENKSERVSEGLPTQEKIAAYNQWAAETKAAYYDKMITKKTEEYEAKKATLTDETELASLEKTYKRTIRQLEAQKAIDVKWESEWHASDTYNVAIGQGRQNYTPLQLAMYCATIANGGTVYQPYIVDYVQDQEGNIILQNQPIVKHTANVSAHTFEVVKDAMKLVTQSGGGAYSQFYDFPAELSVAAKTGTSQPGQASYKENGKQYYDGLFIAFAPADDPQIAFAAVVEYGYNGSGSAGVLGRAVFRKYFGLD